MKKQVNKSRRVLFIIPSFAIGGVTSSLYALIANIDRSRIGVEVFCRHHLGPMKEQFERSCDVLPENIWLSLYIAEGGVIKKLHV